MQFDFGENWDDFSKNAITEKHIDQSRTGFTHLFDGIELENKTFLDIGFGQGLSLLIAKEKKALCVGNDINRKCWKVLESNRKHFPQIQSESIPVVIGSILEDSTVSELKSKLDQDDPGYDIVHSWGVLHHTGNMDKAIKNAASLVKKDGHFIIAIYNKHWSSKLWLFVKWFYNLLPRFLRKVMNYVFYPIIYVAKFLATGKNPTKKERGMDFFYDVVDWVGGYPYEYESIEGMCKIMEKQNFQLEKVYKPVAPTGCNEFVFVKKS